ncbi:hypothetical protein AB0I52_20760 [Streptomyces sp. NPDC050423]|uniref:hypothetical protein n=1 Tax=Streptomyces sp. NPDC050423 TaxID=3155402 RepID=UPI00343B2419
MPMDLQPASFHREPVDLAPAEPMVEVPDTGGIEVGPEEVDPFARLQPVPVLRQPYAREGLVQFVDEPCDGLDPES